MFSRHYIALARQRRPTVPPEVSNYVVESYVRLRKISKDDEAQKKPVLLMGSELDHERYGACLKNFKQRLGLRAEDPAPLAGLCNVSMSPFPTAGNFVRELADAFRKVAEEEVQVRFSLLREDLANADRRRIAGSECMLRRLSTASSCREQRRVSQRLTDCNSRATHKALLVT